MNITPQGGHLKIQCERIKKTNDDKGCHRKNGGRVCGRDEVGGIEGLRLGAEGSRQLKNPHSEKEENNSVTISRTERKFF